MLDSFSPSDLQLLAGLALGIGALFTGITLVFNREQQITERFSRSIDHLESGRRSVRLRGIYSLERIARDSPRDREAIRRILEAYLVSDDTEDADRQAAVDVLSRISAMS